MPSPTPPPSPPHVPRPAFHPLRPSEIGWGPWLALTGGTVFVLALGAFVLLAAIRQDDLALPGRVIATIIGLGFSLLGLVMVAQLLTASRVPSVTADSGALHLQRDAETVTVPWTAIRAVGVGVMHPPAVTGVRALVPRGAALEVFLRPDRADVTAPPAWLVADEAPPRPDLAGPRLRLVVGAGTRPRKDAERLVAQYRPDLWIGTHERAWHRTPGH